MKVSEVSDDELNLFAAEKLGYRRGNIALNGSTYEGWYDPDGNFDVNDPDIIESGDGLKMMLEHHKFVSLNKLDDCDEGNWEACFCKSETHSISCEEFGRALADDMGHAICRAFALANGWVDEEKLKQKEGKGVQ